MATITCKAAVLWGPNEDFVVEDVQVAAPRTHEVRVRIVATGVCHTDQYTRSGHDSEAVFPVILGHEGAGVVESVGEGVAEFQVGDHVVPLYIPQCGECKFCVSLKTNLCGKIRATQGRGLMPDGTSRFQCKGQAVYHYMGTSTFSEYTVVAAISLAKIDKAAPLNRVCLLGCGIPTGYGAIMNVAQPEVSDSVCIFGMGCVGLSAVHACANKGIRNIVAVDINPDKEKIAREFGATQFVNPKVVADIKETLMELSDGGFDYSIECIGNTGVMRTALEVCHKGWGKSIIIGVAGAGETIQTLPFYLVTGRSWTGCAFGGYKSRDAVPKLVEGYLAKDLKIDEFVSHELSLCEINEAFRLLHEGKAVRTVLSNL